MTSMITRLVLLAALLQPWLVAVAADDGGPDGGVAVTVGPTDGAREVELVAAGRFLVAHVTSDPVAAQTLRGSVAERGLAGAVTVIDALERGKLPFNDDLVALAIIEGADAPADTEILRVLRPDGVARIRTATGWRRVVKPWPAEYAHWGHYQRDETFNEVTSDRAVGVPAGFQWIADSAGRRADTLGVRVADGIAVSVERLGREWSVVARDAFSGLERWSEPASGTPSGKVDLEQGPPFNQYTFLVAEGRVYLHAIGERFAKAFDLQTGRVLTTYDKGIEVAQTTTKGMDKDRGLQLRRDLVHRGTLLQVFGAEVCALDFATGRRLWRTTHPHGKGWDRPAAADGILVLTEATGQGTDRPRKLAGYIRSSCLESAAVVGLAIADGRQLWRTALPSPAYPLDNCIRDGRYFLSMTRELRDQDPIPAKRIPTLCIAIHDGTLQWQHDMEWAGGHPPHLMATSSLLWQTSHSGGVGLPVGGSGSAVLRTDMKVNRQLALWGCNTTWMSERFFFSRLGVCEVETGRFRHNTAVRSACVFGTTPACGLLYSTPHVCGCHGTVNGYTAVHSRDMRSLRVPWPGPRLIAGSGKPSPASAAPVPAADEWPAYLRDSARTSWVDTELAKSPKPAWSISAPPSRVPTWLAALWSHSIQRPGMVTALTAAEGIVAGAYMDQHAVFALDPASGAVRWKARLDSAVDSPPTIHRGALYVGTRGGWLWALSRDTGAVIWRFMAAPHQRLMVVNGRFESAWPLFGTVAIHQDRLLVSAGRSVELDEGIFWWSLDPQTGVVRSSGRIHDDEEWFTSGTSRTGRARLLGINSPIAVDGDFALLAPVAFRPSDGSLLVGGRDYASSQYDAQLSYRTPMPLPGMYGLVYDGEAGGGRTGPSAVYGGLGGRIIAYRKDDFVGLQAGKAGPRGGGGRFVGRWRRKPPTEQPRSFAELSSERWTVPTDTKKEDTATGLAVVGSTVAAAMTRNGRPRLLLYAYADGIAGGELPIPAPVVFAGISAAKGTLFVACNDGSIHAFR